MKLCNLGLGIVRTGKKEGISRVELSTTGESLDRIS